MSVLAMVILLLTVMENDAAVKSIVSLEPPWRKIFKGESVTLTCNMTSTEQGKWQYAWYKHGRNRIGNNKDLTIQNATTGDTGNYQCTAINTDISDGVRLEVSNDEVILQVPYAIFEADDLSLRCRTSLTYSVQSVTFYKNDQILSSESAVYSMKAVDMSSNGKYRCKFEYKYHSGVYHDETFVTIQELFPVPIISVRPYSVTEGDNMAVSCDTTIHPLRSAKKLHFAFYKNGQKVKEFSSSNEYHVGSAHLEDAGDYTCEAKTQTDDIRRMSKRLHILVEKSSRVTVSLQPMEGQLIEGNNLEVTCSVTTWTGLLEFSWCNLNTKHCEKKQINAPEHRFTVESVSRSYSGQYYCAVLKDPSGKSERSKIMRINVRAAVKSVVYLEPPWRKIFKGESVTLTCYVASTEQGKGQYVWYKDGSMIIGNNKDLAIQNANTNNTGNYQCTASNTDISDGVRLEVSNAAVKSVVYLEPPWRKIFKGESVTLTCNVASTEQGKGQYVWYKDGRMINGNNKDLTIQKAGTGDTGNYQCTGSNTDISDGVRLEVSDDEVILQVPYIIFEEDDLSLRCRTSLTYTVQSVIISKNGQTLSSESPVYSKKGVDLSSSGKYGCVFKYIYHSWMFRDDTDVTIQELFPVPNISVSPYPLRKGDNMTVSCDTTVHLLRSTKNLHFAFYKNDQNVKEFSSSNKYQVVSADLEHAGYYTCEAKTQTGNIKRMSPKLNIPIIEGKRTGHDYRVPIIILLILSACVLITATYMIFQHMKEKEIKSPGDSKHVHPHLLKC
ncbi:Fc receptor-like protein 5 [Discoglossus pictus]